jgi:flagellar hook-associated protein 3 FlgL
MRVTSTSYYNNIYGENNTLNQQLFDVNKQISSGQKIQYAHEDPGVFIDTLRLDDEVTTLTQTKNSTDNAYKMSTQTDTTIGDMVKVLESMKVKMVNASTNSQSDASLHALADDMRGLKNNLVALANTSIGGQFLFSGTATGQKPIDENGNYQGNNKNLEAFLGSGLKQKYNISGSQLFLGNESNINRTISTNVTQLNQQALYPDIMKDTAISRSEAKNSFITPDNTIRDLMGDTDTNTTNDSLRKSYFYIEGTRTNGDTFKQKIDIGMDAKVSDLLKKVSDAFGPNQVDISLNATGQIQIADKMNGSSKIDFHIVGAVDFGTDGIDNADTTNLNTLQSGTNDFSKVIDGSNPLYIKEFIKSDLTSADPTASIQGLVYDQLNFSKNGAKLVSNASQIINSTNEYATDSTKLEDVSGMSNVSGRVMALKGNDINGNPYDINILLGTPSTFTNNLSLPTPTTYNIYGVAFDDTVGVQPGVKEAGEGIPSNANEITYRQLMDVVNMAVTGTLPATDSIINNPADYDQAIANANDKGKVSLSADGKLTFEDLQHSTTNAQLALYDTTSSSFFPPIVSGNALTFQSNNALTTRDPKKDFFAEIDQMIQSVEKGKTRPDGNDTRDPRNIGMQNSIQMLDDLSDHVSRLQATSGSYSQVLQSSSDRSSLLIVNTKMLRSDVLDTDIAEATLRMQQLSLNYQAMLSSISKVSKLSLVNYL